MKRTHSLKPTPSDYAPIYDTTDKDRQKQTERQLVDKTRKLEEMEEKVKRLQSALDREKQESSTLLTRYATFIIFL